MKSALQPYFEKRNFDVTREPTGGKATRGALSFDVQIQLDETVTYRGELTKSLQR